MRSYGWSTHDKSSANKGVNEGYALLKFHWKQTKKTKQNLVLIAKNKIIHNKMKIIKYCRHNSPIMAGKNEKTNK